MNLRNVFISIVLSVSLLGCENKMKNDVITTNQFHNIVQIERESYIKGYLESYKIFSADKEGKTVLELLVRPNQMPWPDPYAQIRIDMMSNINEEVKATRYEQEHPTKNYKTVSFTIDNSMKVDLSPFVWNRVEFRSTYTPSNIEPLTKWTNKWMDLEDKNPVDFNGFSNVVHSVTYPNSNNSFWYFMVDFGSAPADSFDELLITLKAMGITNITVGSFSQIEK
jgi:hypothetical protein